jgi:hemerythrin
MTVEWRNELEMGIRSVDAQHRELFRRFGLLMEAIDAGQGEEEVEKMLKFLDRYVAVHFRDEEKEQQNLGYPHQPLHQNEHRQFLRDVGALKSLVAERGYSRQTALLAGNTMFRWLVQHITRMDMDFADFVRGHHVIELPEEPGRPTLSS